MCPELMSLLILPLLHIIVSTVNFTLAELTQTQLLLTWPRNRYRVRGTCL